MDEKRILRYGLWGCAAALGLWLGVRFVLPAVLPLLLGFGLACLAEPAVKKLLARTRLPRWASAGICLGALYCLLGLFCWLLLRQLLAELTSLSSELPELLGALSAPSAKLRAFLDGLADRAPNGLKAGFQQGVDSFFETGAGILAQLPEKAISLAARMVRGLPQAFLFLITTILSSFFISADFPSLRRQAKQLIPKKWRSRTGTVTGAVQAALGSWLKAELKLIGVNFCVITVGLTLLRIRFALLLGALIALIDALPVLGTGTVLLPWSLLMFLRGEFHSGIGLLLLYATAALTRSVLEPRLLGRQMGLSPLVTLSAVYIGYRFCGLAGMIVFPILAMLFRQFYLKSGFSFSGNSHD